MRRWDNDQPEPVGHLLVRVFHLHRARAHELLDRLGLYQGQPPVLRALWEQEGLTQTQLVETMKIAPATLTKMLQRMEKAGFIQRRPDAVDQRISRVYLTEHGRAVQAEVERTIQQIDRETFAGLDDADQAALRALLEQMRDNLQKVTGYEIKSYTTETQRH